MGRQQDPRSVLVTERARERIALRTTISNADSLDALKERVVGFFSVDPLAPGAIAASESTVLRAITAARSRRCAGADRLASWIRL
jgi:hypothetical protein